MNYGQNDMYQYLTPNNINFYRMVPNYFFGAGSGRYVTVQTQNSLQFVVCTSRTIVLPMQNSTTSINGEQGCTTIGGNSNSFNYDLSNACNGYPTIHACPPLYLSVQGVTNTNSGGGSGTGSSVQTVSCQDAACQTPDQARYQISVVNMGCYNGVAGLYASFATIVFAYMLHLLFQ